MSFRRCWEEEETMAGLTKADASNAQVTMVTIMVILQLIYVLYRPLQTFLRKVVDLMVNNNRLWLIEGGTSPEKRRKGYCWMLQKMLHTFQLYEWLMIRHVQGKKEMWSNKWARPSSVGVESLGGTVRLWRCLHWGEAMEATPIWEDKCQYIKSHHPLNNRPLDWEKMRLYALASRM